MSYVCPKCGKELKYKKSLKNHLVNCGRTEWPCPKCGKVFETRFQLGGHKSSTAYRGKRRGPHNGQEKYAVNRKKSNLTCPYCFKKFKKGNQKSGHIGGCKLNPKYEQNLAARRAGQLKRWKGKCHTQETKLKIRKTRLAYLKANPDKVPYKLNHSSVESYPEKLLKCELEKRGVTGCVQEYTSGLYSYDFAWPDIKLDVEVDGGTHNQEKVQQIDAERDKFSIANGWRVYRATAAQVQSDVVAVVDELLAFAKDVNTTTATSKIVTKAETRQFKKKQQQTVVTETRQLKKQQQRLLAKEVKQARQNVLVEQVKQLLVLGVNTDKFGWVTKVANFGM